MTAVHVKVRIKKLADKAIIPEYKSQEAAGFDLYACLGCAIKAIPPNGELEVPCGIAIELMEPGYELQIRSRSGLRFKHRIEAYLGTIDSDFRGELTVLLRNNGPRDFVIKDGMRIAQGVIAPVVRADFELVGELSETDRGAKGFGSTGFD